MLEVNQKIYFLFNRIEVVCGVVESEHAGTYLVSTLWNSGTLKRYHELVKEDIYLLEEDATAQAYENILFRLLLTECSRRDYLKVIKEKFPNLYPKIHQNPRFGHLIESLASETETGLVRIVSKRL